ncbi:MAG: deoxyribose-phosphate aldolase [Rikenellaceae bacterium]|nr:deoxyribose-phosphate aldolase [Rikenellaceae bacterium]
MDYAKQLDRYNAVPTSAEVAELVAQIKMAAVANNSTEVLKQCYASIDLTTLDCCDSERSVAEFVRKAVEFRAAYPEIPDVASICVYPSFVETVGVGLGSSNIAITSVAGGFPSSQTFIEVKMLEVAMAAENGADEVDVVINVGEMLEGEYDRMANTLEVLRGEIDEDVVMKVIVESGALQTPELIYKASLLAMLAGADFVKTSTGKIDRSATPEAAVAMCLAIRDYYAATGRKVGFKVAGGVRTAEDAVLYYSVVAQILGEEWLTPSLFRIGASSLANNLISAITSSEVKYY